MLNEIKIQHYKGIQGKPLELGGLKSVNYLIGKNGSGKSSVLEATLLGLNDKYIEIYCSLLAPSRVNPFRINLSGDTLTCKPFLVYKDKYKYTFLENELLYAAIRLFNINKVPNDRVNDPIKDLKLATIQDLYCKTYINDDGYWGSYKKLVDAIQDQLREVYDFINPNRENPRYDFQNRYKIDSVLTDSSGSFELRMFLFLICNIVTSCQNTNLILFDEPFLSLEAKYQKLVPKLLEILSTQLGLQFIISTHSPYLINTALQLENQKVYHLEAGNCSNPNGITKDNFGIDTFNPILESLGVKPSDMLFANGIIWVEGPSDVIYIEEFLRIYSSTQSKQFNNGTNYTYCYHGNANAQYAVWGNSEPTNLIKLLNINPKYYFIFDSDVYNSDDKRIKRKKENGIKATFKSIIIDRRYAKEMQHSTGYHKNKRIIAKYLNGKNNYEEINCQDLSDFEGVSNLWYDSSVATIEDYLTSITYTENYKPFKPSKSGLGKILKAYEFQKYLANLRGEEAILKLPNELNTQLKKLYDTVKVWNI